MSNILKNNKKTTFVDDLKEKDKNNNIIVKMKKQKVQTLIVNFTRSLRNNINFRNYKSKMTTIKNHIKIFIKNNLVKKTKSYYINPKNRFLMPFKQLVSIIVLISIIFYSPLFALYDNINFPKGFDIFFYFFTGILIIDILLNFFIAYYKNNILIKSVKDISKKYLLTWFILDLFYIYPFRLFNLLLNKNIIFIYKCSRILRIFKLFQLKQYFISFLSKFFKRGKDRIVFYIIIWLLIIHSIACVWLVIGSYHNNSWITGNNFDSMFDRYLGSIYWSLYTIFQVGYGDIVIIINNKLEVFFAILVNFYSIVSSSIIISTISNILYSYLINTKKKEKINCMLNKYKNDKIDEILFKKIKKYLDKEYIENKNLLDLNKILPRRLNFELKCEIIEFKLLKLNFFKTKSKEFNSYISQFLECIEYVKGDYIFKKNEAIEYIYFIYKGNISLYSSDNINTCKKIISFRKGEFFGDYEIINNIEKRLFFSKSDNSSYLFRLNKIYIEDIFVNKFPNFKNSFLNVSKKNTIKINKKLNNLNLFKNFEKKRITNYKRLNKSLFVLKLDNLKINFNDIFNKLDNIIDVTKNINNVCNKNKTKSKILRKQVRVLSKVNQYENYINLDLK